MRRHGGLCIADEVQTEAAEILEQCKTRGLIIGKGGLYGNVLRIKPPMCITKDDAGFLVDCLDDVLSGIEAKSQDV